MVRRARPEDAKQIGDVFVAARAGMTYLPRQPSDDGFRDFIAHKIMGRDEVWVAESDGRLLGFMTLEGELVDHMYVHPSAQGRGTGASLLDVAKTRRPRGFHLWVFQKNEGARRFYERHGLSLVELTDGQGNMERESDARYEWAPLTGVRPVGSDPRPRVPPVADGRGSSGRSRAAGSRSFLRRSP